MSLSYLITKGADVFEEPQWWKEDEFLESGHAATVILLKFRILMKLGEVQNTARALAACCLSLEIINQVRGWLLDISTLARHPDLANADTATLTRMIKRVKDQIWGLYLAMEKSNTHFGFLLVAMYVKSEEVQKPESFTLGSLERAQLILSSNYPAWAETSRVLDQIDSVWRLRINQRQTAHRDAFAEAREFIIYNTAYC